MKRGAAAAAAAPAQLHSRQQSPQHHHARGDALRSLRSPGCVLLACGTLLVGAWAWWALVALRHAAHGAGAPGVRASGSSAASAASAASAISSSSSSGGGGGGTWAGLEALYGPEEGRWPAAAAGGPCQVLLLSYFSSRASLLARLLMLMGVWAGEAGQLRIDRSNPLRWWELAPVKTLNDLVLQQHAAPGLPAHLARGFSLAQLTPAELEYYRDRLHSTTRYLNSHKPWLLKDPRLAWLAPLWLEHLDSPLCLLLVDMDPQRLAQRLSQQQAPVEPGADGALDVSAVTHLERWTNSTLSAIKACFAVPTIVVPNSVLQPPLLQPFLAVLQQHLQLAGVQGTRLPPDALLQQEFVAHLHHSPYATGSCTSTDTASDNSSTIDGAALLQEACNWLPPPQPAGLGQDNSGAALPVPTMALLEALREHLEATLAHPQHDQLYNTVAGRLYSSWVSKVKALVNAGHGTTPHEEHHSLSSMLLEALEHVEQKWTATLGGEHRFRV